MRGTCSSRTSSQQRMQCSTGVAAISAERKDVLPAPGGPETSTEAEAFIAVARKAEAGGLSESRVTRESRV